MSMACVIFYQIIFIQISGNVHAALKCFVLTLQPDIISNYIQNRCPPLSNLNTGNFHSLEVVNCVNETQIQVGENYN